MKLVRRESCRLEWRRGVLPIITAALRWHNGWFGCGKHRVNDFARVNSTSIISVSSRMMFRQVVVRVQYLNGIKRGERDDTNRVTDEELRNRNALNRRERDFGRLFVSLWDFFHLSSFRACH